MELNRVRVREPCRRNKPFRSLDTILTTSDQGNDSLRVEAACIIDGLKEDLVQLVDLGCIGCSIAWWLVDWLKGHKTRLAGQFRSNLIPQSVELFFDHGQVGTRGSHIRPNPGI